MFTGIIEEVGTIREIKSLSAGAVLTVAGKVILPDLKIGDSIAVNGVCLTATRIDPDAFVCDVSSETLRRSNLGQAKTGTEVNLERALLVGGRLGGHFVLGHVDGVGRLTAKTRSGAGYVVSFSYPRELERYLVFKGFYLRQRRQPDHRLAGNDIILRRRYPAYARIDQPVRYGSGG